MDGGYERAGWRTAHVDSIGKKVRCIGNEDDETALNLGHTAYVGEFEQQTRRHPDDNPNDQAAKEHKQENANTFEKTQHGQLAGDGTLAVFLCGLKKNDGDGVIEDGLAEDDGVELRVDLVGGEDGENGDGVGGR